MLSGETARDSVETNINFVARFPVIISPTLPMPSVALIIISKPIWRRRQADKNIVLVDGDLLVELMLKHNAGCEKSLVSKP